MSNLNNNNNIDRKNQILNIVKQFYKPEQLKTSKLFRKQFLVILDRAKNNYNLTYAEMQVDFKLIKQLRKL